MEKVKKLFYEPREGLINSDKLFKKVKEKGIDVSRKEVNEFYKRQPITQIMHRTTKPKKYNSVVANYPSDIYQLDIIVYDRYKINNYQYIMVVIDIYSRYMEARAMTNRRMETIIKNFNDILNVMGVPNKLECDNEFNKSEFNEYLEENDIEVVFSDPDQINKNSIVERVNGTIALQLQKIRITTNNYKWYEYLPDVVYNYNRTIHSTIKNRPFDVFTGKKYNEQEYTFFSNPFKVNDKVRIKRKRKVFDKGDQIKFSKEIYVVEEIKNKRIKLIGIQKLYKPEELISIADVDNEIVEEPKTETKRKQIENLHKRLDINTANILTDKRLKKPSIKYLK